MVGAFTGHPWSAQGPDLSPLNPLTAAMSRESQREGVKREDHLRHHTATAYTRTTSGQVTFHRTMPGVGTRGALYPEDAHVANLGEGEPAGSGLLLGNAPNANQCTMPYIKSSNKGRGISISHTPLPLFRSTVQTQHRGPQPSTPVAPDDTDASQFAATLSAPRPNPPPVPAQYMYKTQGMAGVPMPLQPTPTPARVMWSSVHRSLPKSRSRPLPTSRSTPAAAMSAVLTAPASKPSSLAPAALFLPDPTLPLGPPGDSSHYDDPVFDMRSDEAEGDSSKTSFSISSCSSLSNPVYESDPTPSYHTSPVLPSTTFTRTSKSTSPPSPAAGSAASAPACLTTTRPSATGVGSGPSIPSCEPETMQQVACLTASVRTPSPASAEADLTPEYMQGETVDPEDLIHIWMCCLAEEVAAVRPPHGTLEDLVGYLYHLRQPVSPMQKAWEAAECDLGAGGIGSVRKVHLDGYLCPVAMKMSVIFQDAVLHGDSASMCLGEVARYVDRKAVGLGLRGAAHAFAVEHVSDAGEGQPGILLYTVHMLCDTDLASFSLNLHTEAMEAPGGKLTRRVPCLPLLEPLQDGARELSCLHRDQVVHGDVKPENMLVVKELGMVAGILGDLGSSTARRVGQHKVSCSQTTTNATGSYACESSDVHAYGMNIGRTVFGHTMGLFTCLKGAQWCSHPRWLPSVVDRAQGADAGELEAIALLGCELSLGLTGDKGALGKERLAQLTNLSTQHPDVVKAMRRLLALIWRCISAPTSQTPITAQEVAAELGAIIQELRAAEERAGGPLYFAFCNTLFPPAFDDINALAQARKSDMAAHGGSLADLAAFASEDASNPPDLDMPNLVKAGASAAADAADCPALTSENASSAASAPPAPVHAAAAAATFPGDASSAASAPTAPAPVRVAAPVAAASSEHVSSAASASSPVHVPAAAASIEDVSSAVWEAGYEQAGSMPSSLTTSSSFLNASYECQSSSLQQSSSSFSPSCFFDQLSSPACSSLPNPVSAQTCHHSQLAAWKAADWDEGEQNMEWGWGLGTTVPACSLKPVRAMPDLGAPAVGFASHIQQAAPQQPVSQPVQQHTLGKGSTVQTGAAATLGRKLCSTLSSMARAVLGLLKPIFHNSPSQFVDSAPLLEVVVIS